MASVLWAGVVPRLAMASPKSKRLAAALSDPSRFPIALRVAEKATEVLTYEAPSFGFMANQDFSVVRGTGEEELDWSEARSTLDVSASNVYYHSIQAIEYFRELDPTLGAEELPTVIRIGVENGFSMTRKFSKNLDYNNARTIPDGKFTEPMGFPFETEIWFHAPLQVYRQDFLGVIGSKIPILRKTRMITAQAPSDYAQVPSVIYHEWTHLFTKPWLGVTRDFEVNEGVANYFGSVIAGQPRMGITPHLTPRFYKELRFDRDPGSVPKDAADACCGVYIPRLLWAIRASLPDAPTGARVSVADRIAFAAIRRMHEGEGIAEFRLALLSEFEAALAEGLITAEEQQAALDRF